MPDLENLLVEYCVGVGNGLGKVKNKKSTWKNLIKNLFHEDKVFVDTTCTFAQYQALSNDEKLPKKRAPGNWMAATFRNGSRKLINIIGRSCVVFDLDYITPTQLDAIKFGLVGLEKYAWVMHTTRAHCPEAPRVRLIVPVDRMMNGDENAPAGALPGRRSRRSYRDS
jgi:putative DNA primase/helicase